MRSLPVGGRTKLIFTFNPENSVPQAFINWLFSELPRRGVGLHSIGITASEKIIEARIATPQRQQFKKLTDAALYRQLRDSGAFASPLIPRTDLMIDTGTIPPPAAARHIAAHFLLG